MWLQSSPYVPVLQAINILKKYDKYLQKFVYVTLFLIVIPEGRLIHLLFNVIGMEVIPTSFNH